MRGLVGPKSTLASIWPEGAVERLSSAWIETPFQLMSVAATPSGVQSLHELTGVPIDEVKQLADATAALLTDAERAQIAAGVSVDEMPLGALKPKR